MPSTYETQAATNANATPRPHRRSVGDSYKAQTAAKSQKAPPQAAYATTDKAVKTAKRKQAFFVREARRCVFAADVETIQM
jgi:hypothetical protein